MAEPDSAGRGQRLVPCVSAPLDTTAIGFTGRDWVLNALDAWLADAHERVFLLTGHAGSGKSAIAARLVEISRSEVSCACPRLGSGFLTAAHFCRARDDTTLDPRRVFESIALQLAETYESFRHPLEQEAARPGVVLRITGSASVRQAVRSEVSGVRIASLDLAGLSPRETFDRCLRRPLEQLCARRAAPVVILIDGLDEAVTYDARENLVEVLRATIGPRATLPKHVRFLLTSRLDRRAAYRVADCVLDLNADAPAAVDDVREYAETRLTHTKLGSPERDVVARKVATAGRGNFLYARYVVDELIANPDRPDHPAVVALPQGLDGHYREFLERELATSPERWAECYRPVLGLLAVARDQGLTTRARGLA